MDDPRHIAYVACAMNLLLLLSALLSALTGAGVGARRPEVTQAVSAQSAASQPAQGAIAVRLHRPIAALPVLAISAVPDASVAPVLLATVELWANRRRE